MARPTVNRQQKYVQANCKYTVEIHCSSAGQSGKPTVNLQANVENQLLVSQQLWKSSLFFGKQKWRSQRLIGQSLWKIPLFFGTPKWRIQRLIGQPTSNRPSIVWKNLENPTVYLQPMCGKAWQSQPFINRPKWLEQLLIGSKCMASQMLPIYGKAIYSSASQCGQANCDSARQCGKPTVNRPASVWQSNC